MDRKKQEIGPDYHRIYTDIINKKFPDKKGECGKLLKKKVLSAMDIIKLNNKIFGSTKANIQKYRSYSDSDILGFLEYQTKHQLTNSQLAEYFSLSRNSITKWRRKYLK